MEEVFNNFVEEIKEAGIPCTIKHVTSVRFKQTVHEFVIECGWNYPDEYCYSMEEVEEKIDTEGFFPTICAEYGGKFIKMVKVNGGPKNYPRTVKYTF